MINKLTRKETIMPLRDVLFPIKNGTKQVIEGLVKETGAKTVETYLNLGQNKAIKSQEILFPNGSKATFSEKITDKGIFRIWKHGEDSNVKTFSNKDGDLLNFKAEGHSFVVTKDETINHRFAMGNETHPHRKDIEIGRTKDIFNSFVPNFFKF